MNSWRQTFSSLKKGKINEKGGFPLSKSSRGYLQQISNSKNHKCSLRKKLKFQEDKLYKQIH